MAVNVIDVFPAETVTEVGTGRPVLLEFSVTTLPPLGAAEARVTVQVVFVPGVKPVGLHCREERAAAGAETVITAVCTAP